MRLREQCEWEIQRRENPEAWLAGLLLSVAYSFATLFKVYLIYEYKNYVICSIFVHSEMRLDTSDASVNFPSKLKRLAPDVSDHPRRVRR
jgi:hypothetical protein